MSDKAVATVADAGRIALEQWWDLGEAERTLIQQMIDELNRLQERVSRLEDLRGAVIDILALTAHDCLGTQCTVCDWIEDVRSLVLENNH